MTTPLHAEHPRPQLARPDWQDLNGAWGFADDPRDLGLAADWPNRAELDQAIRVPYPPESRASGVGGSAPHRIVWYHRTWHRTPRPGRRIILHFGAVDYLADVWVNGRHVGRHEGGQTSFGIDVTHSLAADGRQSIVVRAMDDPTDLEQPRGKQDGTNGPGGGGQEGTTGIWQGVWAEEVPPVHVEALRWTPVDNAGTVDLELRLSAAPRDPVRIGVRVFLGDRVLVDDTYRMGSATLSRRLNLFEHAADAEPWRWSPESPTLCDALITVHSGAEADAVHSYLGLRTVGTDESAFLLNQAPYYPRMVLHQGYWPQSHLAAPDPEALRREVELIRSLGFNGVRVHQKVEDPRFLYWCDRLGLLVFADAAAAHRFSGRSLARTTRQWLEIIERDASHPSIVAWIAFHESSGVPDVATSPRQTDAVRALYHLIRASDPSRPVIGNDGFEYVCGELLGIHDYVPNPADLAHRYADRAAVDSAIAQARSAGRRLSLEQQRPPVPVMLTEFGGVPSGPGGPYGDSPDDLLKRLGALLSAVQAARGLAGFCYAQLADTGTERNGLLREDRTPKADVTAIARIIRGE